MVKDEPQTELFSTQDYDNNRNYNHKEDPYFGEKILGEAHRMMGLLRFTPNEDGVFVARCAPDYFVLPALGAYFSSRFGETPWEIIDEKRGLSLSSKNGLSTYSKEEQNIQKQSKDHENSDKNPAKEDISKWSDGWEELWKHYHKTINNESRKNPNLQRQFMPVRYWQYLPEKKDN